MTREEMFAALEPHIAQAVRQQEGVYPRAPSDLSPAEVRAVFAQAKPPPLTRPDDLDVVEHVIALAGRTLPARLYRPRDTAAPAPCLVYFHGGGFTLGGLDGHDAICAMLAVRLRSAVLSVEYRKMPEHRFPAQYDDAFDAFVWVTAQAAPWGLDPARIALGGDSSGANLALAAALTLRATPRAVRYLWLAYPIIGLDFETDSYRRNADAPALTRARCRRIWNDYLDRNPEDADERAAPLLASSLRHLPPTVVLTAEFDPLECDGTILVERLRDDGGQVEHVRGPGLVHGYLKWFASSARASTAIDASIAIATHWK
ncbi:MAG: alpha/beta hydrolase [Proteobacteria bacterium]|nr:alpha/beta hydrolase [Burkholderiales bacterium]